MDYPEYHDFSNNAYGEEFRYMRRLKLKDRFERVKRRLDPSDSGNKSQITKLCERMVKHAAQHPW